MSTEPKLRLEHVTKQFDIRGTDEVFTAVEDINIDVAPGEFLVLVGPSGCGKSTLLDLLGGLSSPTSGRILLDGKQITGPGLDRGIVFQQYALLPWRTARHNIEFGLEAKGVKKSERRELAEHYLELVGLQGFADRYPHELSGGMKQRVAIAPQPGIRPRSVADGRTICSAGRTDARVAAGRASAHLEGHRQDHPVHHPRNRRGHLPRATCCSTDVEARARQDDRRHRHRPVRRRRAIR